MSDILTNILKTIFTTTHAQQFNSNQQKGKDHEQQKLFPYHQ